MSGTRSQTATSSLFLHQSLPPQHWDVHPCAQFLYRVWGINSKHTMSTSYTEFYLRPPPGFILVPVAQLENQLHPQRSF